MTNISKSLVAFFIALGIFSYQGICLWGSGFPESNRILLFSGIIALLYLAIAVGTLMRRRMTFVLSLVLSVFLVAWILRIFGLRTCGFGGGSGLFYRDYFLGDVTYCMDCLFHSAIVESIKNYAVASTLLGPAESISYHVGANWVMALIAKFIGVSGFAMIGYIYPMIFLPLISCLALAAIQKIRLYLGVDANFSIADVFFFLFMMLIPGFSASLFAYFIGSETCLMGSLFLLISLAVLPKIDAAICGESQIPRKLVLFVFIPIFVICTAFSKISAGYAFLALIGGVLLWQVKWRNLRQSTSIIIAGVFYLLLFGCMYLVVGREQTPVLSSNYVYQFLEFGYYCVCSPVKSACLFLPMISLLLPVATSAGKRIRFAFAMSIVASYFVYASLRVFGSSQMYFWINCQLLTLVYFVAIGTPSRCMKFCNRSYWRILLLVLLGLFAYYVVLPLRPVVSVVKNACAQPRPNSDVLQSQRYCEMEKAREFIKGNGPDSVMAYVTKDYWTELSSHERMSKAYIFAVQAYLGIPVLGTIKSDAQHIFVRRAGEWTPIGLPAAYSLDRYLKDPVPEYSENGALTFAREHGFKYLLVCGTNDTICVREAIK